MRLPNFLLCLVLAVSLSGCAFQGVVVEKKAEPSPFYHSVGIDGSYSFMLRDSAGIVRRQIVTPDVFVLYDIGDYFNDLQPGPTRAEDRGSKNVRMAALPRPVQTARTAPATAPVVRAVRKPASTTVATLTRTRNAPAVVPASQPTFGRKVATAAPKPRTAAPVAKKSAPKSSSRKVAAKTKKKTSIATKRSQPRKKPSAPAVAKPEPKPEKIAPMVDVGLRYIVRVPRCR
jgi:hypothetical protein